MKAWLRTDAIKRYLIKNNSTQKEFSKKIGISEMHLSFLINQKISPSPKTRRKFLKELGLDFNSIFFCK